MYFTATENYNYGFCDMDKLVYNITKASQAMNRMIKKQY